MGVRHLRVKSLQSLFLLLPFLRVQLPEDLQLPLGFLRLFELQISLRRLVSTRTDKKTEPSSTMKGRKSLRPSMTQVTTVLAASEKSI
jgi:hypothetical protein